MSPYVNINYKSTESKRALTNEILGLQCRLLSAEDSGE